MSKACSLAGPSVTTAGTGFVVNGDDVLVKASWPSYRVNHPLTFGAVCSSRPRATTNPFLNTARTSSA